MFTAPLVLLCLLRQVLRFAPLVLFCVEVGGEAVAGQYQGRARCAVVIDGFGDRHRAHVVAEVHREIFFCHAVGVKIFVSALGGLAVQGDGDLAVAQCDCDVLRLGARVPLGYLGRTCDDLSALDQRLEFPLRVKGRGHASAKRHCAHRRRQCDSRYICRFHLLSCHTFYLHFSFDIFCCHPLFVGFIRAFSAQPCCLKRQRFDNAPRSCKTPYLAACNMLSITNHNHFSIHALRCL